MLKTKQKESVTLARQKIRDDRLDLIKAISISLVLIWHLKPVSIVSETTGPFSETMEFIVDQLYFNFTLIAVPLFLLTSLYLLFKKLPSGGSDYLLKRCWHLLKVFAFWTIIQVAAYGLSLQLSNVIQSNRLSAWSASEGFTAGLLSGIHPILPVVGDSVFYFLLILLYLSILAYGFIFLKTHSKARKYLVRLSIAIGIGYFALLSLWGNGVPYWRLDNFLIYIPLAYVLAKQNGKVSTRLIIILCGCFLAFGIQDIFFRWNGHGIGTYSRISVVCGALAVFTSCLKLKQWQAPDSVRFLSRFSLGIFAIHKYWQFILDFTAETLFKVVGLPLNVSIFSTVAIYVALAATLLTCLSVWLLARTPLKMFVK